VHGRAATDDDVLRAIDSGFTLLKAIDSIPVEKHVVFNPGVAVYSDAQCQHAIPDVKGLILEATSLGGTTKSYQIFPTTRSNYRVGEQLTWEWSFERSYGFRKGSTHPTNSANRPSRSSQTRTAAPQPACQENPNPSSAAFADGGDIYAGHGENSHAHHAQFGSRASWRSCL
jgi:hypothetical protein